MRKYRLISKKGEGTFSEVLKAQSIKNGNFYAIKCMKTHFHSLEQVNNLREIQALRRLSPQPNIVKLEEVLYDKPTGRLALVFELMDMNLYELIRGRRHYLDPQLVKIYMFQLLRAIAHMHDKGVFHRDLKPENILIENNYDVYTGLKLADFGSCRGMYSKQPYTEYISTRWYRAPECLLTDGYYGPEMDVWGVGCVMFEISALYPLFPGTNELDQVRRIHSVLGTPNAEFLARYRPKASAHIDFNFPPVKGSGIRRLVPHLSDDCIDVLEGLLRYDPTKRISAKDALLHRYFDDLRSEPEPDWVRTPQFDPTGSKRRKQNSDEPGKKGSSGAKSGSGSGSGATGAAGASGGNEIVSPAQVSVEAESRAKAEAAAAAAAAKVSPRAAAGAAGGASPRVHDQSGSSGTNTKKSHRHGASGSGGSGDTGGHGSVRGHSMAKPVKPKLPKGSPRVHVSPRAPSPTSLSGSFTGGTGGKHGAGSDGSGGGGGGHAKHSHREKKHRDKGEHGDHHGHGHSERHRERAERKTKEARAVAVKAVNIGADGTGADGGGAGVGSSLPRLGKGGGGHGHGDDDNVGSLPSIGGMGGSMRGAGMKVKDASHSGGGGHGGHGHTHRSHGGGGASGVSALPSVGGSARGTGPGLSVGPKGSGGYGGGGGTSAVGSNSMARQHASKYGAPRYGAGGGGPGAGGAALAGSGGAGVSGSAASSYGYHSINAGHHSGGSGSGAGGASGSLELGGNRSLARANGAYGQSSSKARLYKNKPNAIKYGQGQRSQYATHFSEHARSKPAVSSFGAGRRFR